MRLPTWLRAKSGDSSALHKIKTLLRDSKLHSVCESAKCPNMGECFSKGTATFMILGSVCTRNCKFCAVETGLPNKVDKDEPKKIADVIKKLKLKHAVITSVTRDDLPDCGANHFAKTIEAIRYRCESKISNECAIQSHHVIPAKAGIHCHCESAVADEAILPITIEVLVPDFQGNESCIKIVCSAKPDVFNHNIETTRDLTHLIRDSKANFDISIDVLKTAKNINPNMLTKSGFMVGLGETDSDVLNLLEELKTANVDIVTIGQYLRPNRSSYEVKKYVEPKMFDEYMKEGEAMGLKVFAGPLVRSSYNAGECFNDRVS